MFRKKYFISEKKFYTTLILTVLAVVISSCSEKKTTEFDINPLADFSVETIEYELYDDGNTYAFVTTKNNSTYSNRWQWIRPGSIEELSGDIELMTDEKSSITTAYLATDEEQYFEITLIAYSDKPTVNPPDTTIYYQPFESEPFTQEIKVKKPE